MQHVGLNLLTMIMCIFNILLHQFWQTLTCNIITLVIIINLQYSRSLFYPFWWFKPSMAILATAVTTGFLNYRDHQPCSRSRHPVGSRVLRDVPWTLRIRLRARHNVPPILQSRVNMVIRATTNWATILWILWSHTDSLHCLAGLEAPKRIQRQIPWPPGPNKHNFPICLCVF